MKTASALAICLLAFGAVATNSQTLTPAAGRNAMPSPQTTPLSGTGSPTRIVTTIAGLTRSAYGNGGAATAAYLAYPAAVCLDRAGNFYIADADNYQVRKVNVSTGIITAVVGASRQGNTGDGQMGVNAHLGIVGGCAVDPKGNLYISDSSYDVVREVNGTTGIISTVAGTGTEGYSGDGGPATQAQLFSPNGLAVDSSGNLYIADTANSAIRKVDQSTGIISTVAGILYSPGSSGDGGPATKAMLYSPHGVAVDSNGNLYISDSGNSRIRLVSAATGNISTYAGSGIPGYSGDGGPAINAEMSYPDGIRLDTAGNLYIADPNAYVVRRVTAATETIGTVAGNRTYGYSGDGGAATAAELTYPLDVAVDANRNLYIADTDNNRIRRVDPSGNISTVAGTGLINPIDNGAAADAVPITIAYESPNAVVADAGGNIYFADPLDEMVRKVSAADGTISTIAGNGVAGYSGDGGPATSAELNFPAGVVLDLQGNLYIADEGNSVVRRVDHSTGLISTFAGNGFFGSYGDGGPATRANLSSPLAVAMDSSGNLYIADIDSERVRKVNPQGIISTVAGNGQSYFGGPGSNGDGGLATNAELDSPDALAVDRDNNLYIGDLYSSRVREVNVATGIINTVVGNGVPEDSGDGGPATSASIGEVHGLCFDAAGNLYIADGATIRIVNTSGIIGTVASQGGVGYSGDGGPVGSAQVTAVGVGVDSASNIYFADIFGSRIRKIWTSVPQAAAATPVLTPAGGSYGSSQTVMLSDSTPNTQIFFTLDGSAPNPGTSSLYSGPLTLIGPVTVSAIAIAPGYSTSAAASTTYSFPSAPLSAAFAPAFMPPSGSYAGTQSVTIIDATPDATLYYTTDGTAPSTSSMQYGGAAITVSGNETIQAFATASGYTNSPVAIASYVIGIPTTIELSSSSNPAVPGANLTFTAAVTTTAAGMPTGTVGFSVDGGPAIVETLDGTGHASYSTSSLAVGQHTIAASYSGDANFAASSAALMESITSSLLFIPVTPCRVVDTRIGSDPFGGPELAAGATREFDLPQSACGIPYTAVAYSLNVTVVPDASLNYLTVWPSGQPQPFVSTLNSDGRVKANAAIIPAGTNGGVSVFVTDPTQVILDIDGYFVIAGTAYALAFHPVTPCRVADTRQAVGPLGGPFLSGGSSRDFPILTSSCGLLAGVQAYSLNVTAVPHSTLNYLTTWPTGQPQPNVSTLNSSTGAVTANAAIVPAGSYGGGVSVFVSDDADVILDVNGYFAPQATGGLSLYTVTPCRVIDTRPTSFNQNAMLAVSVQASTCAPPATAQAYVLNATVVPLGSLNYLTLWPDGETQPYVSTLNADDGAITSNMAIVPTVNGSIDAFADGTTNLILDISSYFAP